MLKDGSFHVRGIVAHKNLAAADDLKRKGCEIIEADIEGPHQNLEHALKGAHAIYIITIPQMVGAKMSEFEQGKRIVDLAHAAKVEQVILCTLPNVERETGGKYKVIHFTDKVKIFILRNFLSE